MNVASECYSAIVGSGADVIGDFLLWLARHRGLDSAIRVLDVGCGRVACSRSSALAYGYEPPHRAGFAELDGYSDFDLVTAINDSFSHLITGEERAQGLRHAFDALRPGGVLFIEVPNFLWILKNYRAPAPLRVAIPNGEVVVQREHEIDFHAATFTTIEHYRLLREGSEQRVPMKHVYAMTSLPELEHQLRSGGFVEVETYGSYSARAVEPILGSRMLLSAVRPVRGVRRTTG